MSDRPRDPDCTCGWAPQLGRIWCEHCLTDGPLPGSLADPNADDPMDVLGRSLNFNPLEG